MHRKISLRFAVSFAFASLLSIALLLSSALQLRNQEQALLSLGEKVMVAEAADVQRHLLEFLAVPQRSNFVVEGLIETMALPTGSNLSALEHPIYSTFSKTFAENTALSVLGFANTSGEFIAMRREKLSQQFTLLLKDERTNGQLRIYSEAKISKPLAVFDRYDPRTRPWYAPVAKQQKALWSDIYTNYDEQQEITISHSRPVFNAAKKLIGVLSSDIRIDQLNQFLINQPDLGSGAIFIVDAENRLIAHSTHSSILADGRGKEQKGVRLHASESPQEIVRAASAYLGNTASPHFQFTLNQQTIFANMIPLQDTGGINWRIYVLVPENDLLGELRQDQLKTIGLILLIGLAIALIGWYLLGRITQPILTTALAAEKLGQADWQPVAVAGPQLRETALLTQTFNEMAAKLALSFEQMNRQIRYDAMTGLLNRNGLCVAVNDWPYTVSKDQLMLLIGLDGYRAINDSVGHTLGDALLKSIAARLQDNLPANALLARTAGAEFTILIPEVLDENEINEITQRYLAYFFAAFQAAESEDEVVVTASIGVLHAPFKQLELNEWLRNASVALSKAKAQGFGSYSIFKPAMIEQSIAKTRLTTELKIAIEKQEFRVYFQPVIDLASGETIGAEALIRWESPRGMISPGVFIPAAEDSGLILQIGQWVLRDACQQIADGLRAGWRADFDIHVNVSVRQLIQSDFYEQLQHIINETGLPPQNLTLEITESCLVTQSEVVANLIKRVRHLGVGIAIDDFGTGYSSLAYLHQFDFDYLKIDQSFVARMLENVQDEAIVSAIVNMASGFKVVLVGEGVETEAQANRLRELGCQRAQGYFFGRPAPFKDWPDT